MAVLLGFASPAAGAVITVNTAADNVASVSECQGAAGDCSLRQAVDKAASGVDTVQIPAGIPAINLVSGHGPITFAKDLTIQGAGAGSNTISGQDAIGIFSITGEHTVTISGVTLTHGKAQFGAAIKSGGGSLTLDDVAVTNSTAGGSNVAGFGAVDVEGSAALVTVNILRSSFSSNHIGGGGTSGDGFGVIIVEGTGTAVTVSDSSFTGNTVGGGGGDAFGVLLPEPGSGLGTLDITGTTFSGNTMAGGGGVAFGMVSQGAEIAGSSISIDGSTFSSNTLGGVGGAGTNSGAALAGGVEASFTAGGSLKVTNSSFNGNRMGGNGGGGTNSGAGFAAGVDVSFSAGGTLTVDHNSFSGNVLGGSGSTGINSGLGIGGGFDASFSGSSAAAVSITSNTFDSNVLGGAGGSNTNSGSGDAGGVDLTTGGNAEVTIAGNTFSGNQLGGNGSSGMNSGEGSGGGALISSFNLSDHFTIVNNTITGNRAGGAAGTGANSGGGQGAGLVVSGGTVLLLNDTIDGNVGGATAPVSAGGIFGSNGSTSAITLKNTILSGNTVAGAPNNCSSPLTSGGHNIEDTNPSQCGLGTGDFGGVAPLLGALAANGGPTLTQRPLAGSPAVDHGDNSGCPATDQRGSLRPVGACDIGAFELAPPGVITGSASAIKAKSATLAGTIANPDVLGGSVHFDFGTSTSYGSQTGAQAIGPLAPASGASAVASGLKPNTLYHFREVATNPDGTSVGADKTFKTAPPAPKLSKLAIHPSAFAAAHGRGASTSARKTGARVSYRDSQAATTTFTVQVKRRGFRVGKRCKARKPSHGKARRCTFYKSLGSFRHRDKTGKNGFHFTGRARRKPLHAGRYRLQAVARKNGVKSRPAFKQFGIV